MNGSANQRLTEVVAATTGTRFCSTCQSVRPAEGGKWSLDKFGNRRRWRCEACLQRMRTRAPSKGSAA